jgi:hypothetical protein
MKITINKEKLEDALTSLVGAMYDELKGAYGATDYYYDGRYEHYIQDVMDAFVEEKENGES